MNTIDKLGDEETFRQIVERSITSFIDDEITALAQSSFFGCSELQEVSLPLVTELPRAAFQKCSKLTTFNWSNIMKINDYAFDSCGFTEVNGPLVTYLGMYAFSQCSSITNAKFPKATTIKESAFSSCSKLSSLIVGTELADETAICTLGNSNALPSSIGAIYVPYNLVEKYKTAKNWSSFTDKIQPYETPVSCQSLTITVEDVPWYKTSAKVHYEAVCTYSIEGVMQTGTKVFKGDTVSDTFSTNPSEESSRQIEVSYTFLGQTATMIITQGRCVGDPTGGTIFYIDSSADGVYEFYDINGELISDVAVGDKPSSYKIITPGSKDKYYILHEKLYGTSLGWTYSTTGGNTHVWANLGTKTAIGTGKSNTATVLAADDGAYISEYPPTIWYQLQQIRNAYTNGCNDWFVPSMGEAGEVRKAGLMALEFNNNYIWISSESNSTHAYMWKYYDQDWGHQYKSTYGSVFVVRAF